MKRPLFTTFAIMLFSIFSHGQDSTEPSRILHKYISGEQVSYLRLYANEQYQTLLKYYTATFEVTRKDGTPVNYQQFYNSELFDVTLFESQREQSSSIALTFKDDYLITLKPLHEIEDDLTSKNSIVDTFHYSIFPTWNSNWNEQSDFRIYRILFQNWKKENEMMYQNLLSKNKIKRLTHKEYLMLSNVEKNKFLANQYHEIH